MKRLGAVVTFKKGLTAAQAAEALKAISSYLDTPETTTRYNEFTDKSGRRWAKPQTVPFQHAHLVREFEEDHGGPVWYIP